MILIGQRIKARREELGISQTTLAKKVGMSGPSLSLVESGKTKRPRNLERIAAALKVPVGELGGGNGTEKAKRKTATKEEQAPVRVRRLAQKLELLPPAKLKALFVLAGVR